MSVCKINMKVKRSKKCKALAGEKSSFSDLSVEIFVHKKWNMQVDVEKERKESKWIEVKLAVHLPWECAEYINNSTKRKYGADNKYTMATLQ